MNEFNEEDVPDYQSLRSEESPSLELENRVVAALETEGLIRNKKMHSRPVLIWKTVAAVAACITLFFGGMFLENYRSRSGDPNFVSMSEKTFLLLLIEDERYQPASSEQEQKARIDLYRNWAIALRKEGLTLNGTKLQPQTHFLPLKTAQTAHHSEVAGYFLIDAGDLEYAMEIAKTCPHLRFGGQIEVRQIDPV